MADDEYLRIVAEHRLADVVSFLGETHAIDFTACARHFRGNTSAAGGIGKDPVSTA